MGGNNVDTDGLSQQANELLFDNGYSVNPNSLAYRVLLSKLKASNAIGDELLASIFSEDFIGERELQSLLASTPVAQQVVAPTPIEPESTVPFFLRFMPSFLSIKSTKTSCRKKCKRVMNDYILFGWL